MNALELADLIECACCAYQKEAGAMLRQQQAEIEALKKEAALQRLSDFTQEAESFDRTASHMAGEYVSYNEPVAWKAYEEVHFSDQYILRWVREGDEYVNRITKEMMEDFKAIVHQQQAEIEALKKRPAINKEDGLVCAKCYERIGQ